jgi:acyl dehydratase
MTLDDYLRMGETVAIGSHRFEPDAMKAFARRYDPQPFHVSEELAARSIFGRLCASGWQTAAAWMKCNVATPVSTGDWTGPGPAPENGPSPGFRNLVWPKPVFAGETVSYTRRLISRRAQPTRPGWQLLTLRGEGFDSPGDMVFGFDGAVLIRTG